VDREVFERSVRDKANLKSIEKWVMTGPAEECLDGFVSLDLLTEEASQQTEAAAISPKDGVAIFYTSGTTGFPKGAMMSSNALLTGQKMAAALLPTNARKDFGVLALPISHIMGFCTSLMGMFSGVRGLYMSKFNPKRVLEAIEKYHATYFVGVPAMYAMMLAEGIDKYDLSSMKAWCSAADAMPQEHIDIFRKKGGLVKIFGKPIMPAIFIEAYGMVELAGISMIKFDLPLINFAKGCVGVPVYPFKVKVMKESGEAANANQVGEIWIRGPGVTNGYYNNPEASRELIKDGWLNTGDMGKKNRLGLIYFVDRKKDVIKSGGYSIFSVEIEHKLMEHPAVSRAVVFGVPHPTKKEVPVAIIALRPDMSATETDLISWSHTHMADYKAPRAVLIIPEAEIPMGMTMKVLKKDLRVKYQPELQARMAQGGH
jgi:acyl-CoA synthetase (AMP-forming)/AMP-acid ligase II